MKELTLGQVMGVDAGKRDELVAYTTGTKVSVVKAERSAEEKAARRAWWEGQLIARLPELIAYCRKDNDACAFCDKTRATLSEVWGPESPLEGPVGKVVFTIDLSDDRKGLGLERHDRYHVEKALRSIRTQEFKDRQARREAKAKRNKKLI
jgi:hypothetical protein